MRYTKSRSDAKGKRGVDDWDERGVLSFSLHLSSLPHFDFVILRKSVGTITITSYDALYLARRDSYFLHPQSSHKRFFCSLTKSRPRVSMTTAPACSVVSA
jgi:hypothetical protein